MPNRWFPVTEYLKTRVSSFDDLIEKGGIEAGNTVLVSGGCGVGKTVFTLQSLYNGALAGEKGMFISLSEDVEKIRANMINNFGWDLASLEEKGLLSLQKVDPFYLAEDVTSLIVNRQKRSSIDRSLFDGHDSLSLVDSRSVKMPFKPDRIVLDSVSTLEAAFTNKDHYRIYIQALVDSLNQHNSLNFLICESEQDPSLYSKTGIEEFLVDGVIVFYNLRKGQVRRRALEILKLRCSDHVKELVSYMITGEGIKIMPGEQVF
ncbi:MAG: hypothetical protein GF416_07295 [Candidatus Altiarchaeales archaeon]|nr:hypothetical protein [Candidatus Altiarchaeales archaeon]MBD3416917.1 hypothetical protein [Candidatus Altiarchaeales archaeon]